MIHQKLRLEIKSGLELSVSPGSIFLPPSPPPPSCRVMAFGWSMRWSWPTASPSGRSTSLPMSLVRAIILRHFRGDSQWHEPAALSTANKAQWTEQITIMKGWPNELIMTDELSGSSIVLWMGFSSGAADLLLFAPSLRWLLSSFF